MDWSDLRYALAVARTGSVAQAAKQLRVAHTTVYRRLNAFESAFDAKFFDRSVTPYTLTPAGQALLDVGSDVDARIEAFDRSLRGQDARIEGRLRLATVTALGTLLPPILHRLEQRHPHIEVQLQVTQAMVELGRDADIALRVTKLPADSLHKHKIADIAFAVYGASRVVGAHADPLATARWVVFDASLARTPQGRWEAAHAPADRIALRTNARQVFIEAVSLGMGIGVLPCGLAAKIPHLVPLSPALPELKLPLWLLTHSELVDMPRVRVVLDFLIDALTASRDEMEGRHLLHSCT